MPYEKHIWEKGDKITAERLNNIEDAIAAVSEGNSGDNSGNEESATPNGNEGNSSNEKIILLDMTLTDTNPVTYSVDNL